MFFSEAVSAGPSLRQLVPDTVLESGPSGWDPLPTRGSPGAHCWGAWAGGVSGPLWALRLRLTWWGDRVQVEGGTGLTSWGTQTPNELPGQQKRSVGLDRGQSPGGGAHWPCSQGLNMEHMWARRPYASCIAPRLLWPEGRTCQKRGPRIWWSECPPARGGGIHSPHADCSARTWNDPHDHGRCHSPDQAHVGLELCC